MHSLLSVQILRALAAAMVVLHHIQLNLTLGFGLPNALPDLAVGSAGVDIFFGISGFVMVISSDRLFGQPGAARTFIMRRLIRIVPLYWAVTSLYVVALGGGYGLAQILSSYLFVPHVAPSGAMQPIHVVGWTLNYEMFFYALFALAIPLPRRLAVSVLGIAMIGFVVAGSLTAPTSDVIAFWSRPIILNFVLGLALGLAYVEGVRLPRTLAGVMLAASAVLYWREIGEPFPSEWRRLSVYGLPSALLLAGATLGRFASPTGNLRSVAVMGDASYALYLIHPLVLWACRMVALKLAIPVASAPWLYAGFVMAAASGVALLANRYFDQPVTGWLRKRFARSASPADALAALAGRTAAVLPEKTPGTKLPPAAPPTIAPLV